MVDDDEVFPDAVLETDSVQNDNDPEPPPQDTIFMDTPCISFHALACMMDPSILKLTGRINGKDMVVLIDGGLTNNFIQSIWAAHFTLTVQSSPHLKVTVGNGAKIQYDGECV